MYRVIHLKTGLFTSGSTFNQKVEQKLKELTADGWDILNVSYALGAVGWIAYITYYSLGHEEYLEMKDFRLVKLKKKSSAGLTKAVDDELLRMQAADWDIVSVSFAKNSWGVQCAFITISRPSKEDFV